MTFLNFEVWVFPVPDEPFRCLPAMIRVCALKIPWWNISSPVLLWYCFRVLALRASLLCVHHLVWSMNFPKNKSHVLLISGFLSPSMYTAHSIYHLSKWTNFLFHRKNKTINYLDKIQNRVSNQAHWFFFIFIQVKPHSYVYSHFLSLFSALLSSVTLPNLLCIYFIFCLFLLEYKFHKGRDFFLMFVSGVFGESKTVNSQL